jgi:hypothetical protein
MAYLLVALVGCSGRSAADEMPDAASPAAIEAARYVDQLADQLCEVTAQCCSAVGYKAPSDCQVRARQELHDSLDTAIAFGSTLNAETGEQCLAAYRDLARTCSNTWSAPPACSRALVGMTPPGGPCDHGCAPASEGDVVCAFTLTLGGDAGQVRSPSVCQIEIVRPPGGACDADLDQSVVHVCDPAGGSWCFGNMCSVPVPIGGACKGNDCVSGAYCREATCQPRVAIGQTCSGAVDECETGATCDAMTMTCKGPDRWKRFCGGAFN